MKINLSPKEVRVLGALIEKEITTPDQYPLSLNALVNACNQKSSRDPVMSLTEPEISTVVDSLVQQHLVTSQSGFGSRVVKFRQRFCNTEFGEWQFSGQELGVLCVLMLRGPQTAGELRSNSQRLCHFDDASEVNRTLDSLVTRADGPWVMLLPREPGKRESRYAHLMLSLTEADYSAEEPQPGSNAIELIVDSQASSVPNASLEQRVIALEQRIALLETSIQELNSNRPNS